MMTQITKAYAIMLPDENFVTFFHNDRGDSIVGTSNVPCTAANFQTAVLAGIALERLQEQGLSPYKDGFLVEVETRTNVRKVVE